MVSTTNTRAAAAGDAAPTEEERRLLTPLSAWLNGRAFQGATRADVHRQHCQHYGAFVRRHLRVDWPVYSVDSGGNRPKGGGEQEEESEHCCSICGSHTLDLEEQEEEEEEGSSSLLLHGSDGADVLCRSFGSCRLEGWGLPPHVAHRECYTAGYLDSLLDRTGGMMGRGFVRQQPSRINFRRLLANFDVVIVPREEESSVAGGAAVAVAGDTETVEQQAETVLCRLKPNEGRDRVHCLFCEAAGLTDNSVLEEMRRYRFSVDPDLSPAVALSLRELGSFSPFPTGGTIVVRPHFNRRHAAAVLRHAVVGTFVDFNGYRCHDLCVVVEEDCVEDGVETDDAAAVVDGKRYLKVPSDDAAYAVLPATVVRYHGVLKLTQWPQPLVVTNGTLSLPGSTKRDAVTNFEYLEIDGDTTACQSVVIRPLQPDDALFQTLGELREWVQNELPVALTESALPDDRPSFSRVDATNAEDLRRGWKTGFLAGIQQMLQKLTGWTGGEDRLGNKFNDLRHMEDEVREFFSPAVYNIAGCQHYRVPKCFGHLWRARDVSVPAWSGGGGGQAAFQAYCRSFIPVPAEAADGPVIQIRLHNCVREELPRSGRDEVLSAHYRKEQHCGPVDAIRVPVDICCREGYAYLRQCLHFCGGFGGGGAGAGGGGDHRDGGGAGTTGELYYALEMADAPFACSRYLVVDPACSVLGHGYRRGLYLAHDYTMEDDATALLEKIDLEASGAVRAVLDRENFSSSTSSAAAAAAAWEEDLLRSDAFLRAVYEEVQNHHPSLVDWKRPTCSTCEVVPIPASIPMDVIERATIHHQRYAV